MIESYFGGRFETMRPNEIVIYDVKSYYKCDCGKNHLLGE